MPLILRVGRHALVLLDEDNMRRIGGRDPLIIDVGEIGRQYGEPVERVIVVQGNEEDQRRTIELCTAGRFNEALRFACRGLTVQPEDSIGMVRLYPSPGDSQS